MWYIKGVVASLLVVAATAIEMPDPYYQPHWARDLEEEKCSCEQYLKNNAWYILKSHYDYKFPDFCCEIGFWNFLYEYIYYYPYLEGADVYLADGMITDLGIGPKSVKSLASATPPGEGERVIDKDLLKQITGAGGRRRMQEETDKPFGPSTTGSHGQGYGGTTGYGGNQGYPGGQGHGGNPYGGNPYGGGQGHGGGGGYGYQDPCYGLYGQDYIICQIVYNFEEAVEACYCNYRASYLQCNAKECKEDKDKDILLDLKVAKFDVDQFCNQCPDHKKDEPDSPYGQTPYGGGGGYDKKPKLKGEPFDECGGYCLMTYFFRKYHHYYTYE